MGIFEIAVILVYLAMTGYLGYLGYRRTRTAADYMIAGRDMHPVVMALSYGSTFISTSAIVGFGGVAATYGMGLLWLVFLNIFVGIFIAFVFLGEPTRRLGHRLGAHTFPELLGKRYDSRFIHVFAGLILFFFMPLYTTAVLLGGAEFVRILFHVPSFTASMIILAVITGAYVLAGGLKGVMYTDALQATIMVAGMIILIVSTYAMLGGVVPAHHALTALKPQVPEKLAAIGHNGWTAFPTFGWGNTHYNLWWILVTSIILGVGIGVLAQPQLVVRFMTVKSRRELNRAVLTGGLFILLLPGVIYTVGALTNVYFHDIEQVRGHIVTTDMKNHTITMLPENETNEAKAVTVPIGPDAEIIHGMDVDVVKPKLISIARTGGKVDQIIPTFVNQAMPRWYGVIFLITLLSAAMSTLSGQFHTMSTAIGRDVYQQLARGQKSDDRSTTIVMRAGVIVGLVASVLLGADSLRDYIAVATAIFFGLCAATFLPAFVAGLFWKRMTRTGAMASLIGGFATSLIWMVFFYEKTATAAGLCKALTGSAVLIAAPNWPVVDPLLIALPVSTILAVVVSLCTAPPDENHLARCFSK